MMRFPKDWESMSCTTPRPLMHVRSQMILSALSMPCAFSMPLEPGTQWGQWLRPLFYPTTCTGQFGICRIDCLSQRINTSDGGTILCDNQAMTGFSLRSIVSTDHTQQTCSFNIHKNYLLQNEHLCVLNMDQAANWDPQRPTVWWFLNSVAMRFSNLSLHKLGVHSPAMEDPHW